MLYELDSAGFFYDRGSRFRFCNSRQAGQQVCVQQQLKARTSLICSLLGVLRGPSYWAVDFCRCCKGRQVFRRAGCQVRIEQMRLGNWESGWAVAEHVFQSAYCLRSRSRNLHFMRYRWQNLNLGEFDLRQCRHIAEYYDGVNKNSCVSPRCLQL